MNYFSFKTILSVAIVPIMLSCNNNSKSETGQALVNEDATLYGTEFLRGKVSAVVYDEKEGCDSLAFIYSKNGDIDKVVSYSKAGEGGFCKYHYNGNNRIEQHYHNRDGVEKSYDIVEFDDRKNITLYREDGYIFPDSTKMTMLYMMQRSYDNKNRHDGAFEYHCDGIPPYKYCYTYNNDGTEIEECFLAVTGDIYKITKNKKDKQGNIIEQYVNYPRDNSEWDSIKYEYRYDNKGNWIERTTKGVGPLNYINEHRKRKIYYLK